MMKLEIKGVSKRYGKGAWGLRDFSLIMEKGVWALLGPNGAGKSSLMRILATISRPSSGEVLWNGEDIVRHPDGLRRVLGYLPQDFGVYPNLSAEEFLEYIAAVKALERRAAKRRIGELLEALNLSDARKRPLGGFSGGMRQRVGIAVALLNDPRLLIVDEPTVGLDPEERVRFRNLLSELSGDRIVLLSTHIVSDVEAAATSIALIDRGRLMRQESPEALVRTVEGMVWDWSVPSEMLGELRKDYVVSGLSRRPDGAHARVVHAQAPSASARPLQPSLEDAYLWAVARSGEEASGSPEGAAV
jgi:ABC-2 type transport system ATP-binding protein